MDKKVIVVLGLVAMVAAVALVLVNRGERGVRRSTEPYPFPKLKVKPPPRIQRRDERGNPLFARRSTDSKSPNTTSR